jgi:hypothetical protein
LKISRCRINARGLMIAKVNGTIDTGLLRHCARHWEYYCRDKARQCDPCKPLRSNI